MNAEYGTIDALQHSRGVFEYSKCEFYSSLRIIVHHFALGIGVAPSPPPQFQRTGNLMSKELIIGLIESGRDQVLRTAQAVPDDRLNWKPLDNGRTVLDLLGDAAQTPRMVTRMLTEPGFTPSREVFGQMTQERAHWTREESLEHLKSNTEEAIAAIRSLSEEKLAEPLHLPMGGGMTLPLGGWIMMIYRAFVSRMAQINYIQTLYGDFESH
ncbi:MAG TPA: DinB family protein [Abditibacteriaceae bacterium]|nr:DinB family protein [Abditibacteriaceae bacterium]